MLPELSEIREEISAEEEFYLPIVNRLFNGVNIRQSYAKGREENSGHDGPYWTVMELLVSDLCDIVLALGILRTIWFLINHYALGFLNRP